MHMICHETYGMQSEFISGLLIANDLQKTCVIRRLLENVRFTVPAVDHMIYGTWIPFPSFSWQRLPPPEIFEIIFADDSGDGAKQMI